MFDKEQCFLLGSVIKPHGLKGHLAFFIDSDTPEKYFKMESVFLEIQGNLVPFFVSDIQRIKPNIFKVGLEDVNTIAEAEELAKKDIYLPLTALPELPDDRFYFHEVEGYQLYNRDELVGDIIRVIDYAANPLFEVVDKNDRSKEYLIPMNDQFLHKVRKKERIIEMDLPEGLLDL